MQEYNATLLGRDGTMDTEIFRKRLKFLREKSTLSQEQLSEQFGFKDRQTLSSIEGGHRRISAEELVKACDIFNVDLSFFTDPYRLVGEGRFSWRQHNIDANQLISFEERAGSWIATYRQLNKLKNSPSTPLLPRAGLTSQSTFEDAAILGEAVAQVLELGSVPSQLLQEAAEKELQVLVLNVNADAGISGAACQLPELNAILINREEPLGRQNFDLAHELFHLLTWDALPPCHVEGGAASSRDEKRIEQLADTFAASLLMPSSALAPYLENFDKQDIYEWLNTTATALGVSSVALKWRLVNLGKLNKRTATAMDDNLLRHNGEDVPLVRASALPFSHDFMSVIAWGLSEGHISARWTANLLDMTLDDLSELFSEYQIESPFAL